MSLGALFWLLLGGETAHARIQSPCSMVFCNAESGYRFYDPNLQRWIDDRELIKKRQGINLEVSMGDTNKIVANKSVKCPQYEIKYS